jgi:hypothetical protein
MTHPPASRQTDSFEQWGGIEKSEERCIELSLPAHPELRGLVRMAVGSVATTIGFDFESVADLRLALDELCNACAVGWTTSSVLHLSCHWNADGLFLSCSVSPVLSAEQTTAIEGLPPGLSERELSRSILTALVDAYGLSTAERGSRRGWLRKSI